MWNKFLNTNDRYFINHPLYGSKVDLADWFIYPSTFNSPNYRDQSYYYDSSSYDYLKLFYSTRDDWNTVWEIPLYSSGMTPMYMFDHTSTPTFTTLIFEHWANDGSGASHLKCNTVDISISLNEKEMYFEYFYLNGSTKENYHTVTRKVSDFYPGLSNYDNFTVPRKLIIELQGGGGGGGSSSWYPFGDAGGGGSAGGYMTFVLSLSNITAWRVHLGFGGGGATGNNQNGSPGDPTYIEIHPDIHFFNPLSASALGGGYGGAATGGGQYEGGSTSMDSEYAEKTDGTRYHVFWQLSSRQGAGGSYHADGNNMNSIESKCTRNRGIAERSTAIIERGSTSGGNCVGGGGGGASVFANGASSVRAGMGHDGSKGSGGAGGSYNATASTDGGDGGSGGILVWY